jgi:hypothetical protein
MTLKQLKFDQRAITKATLLPVSKWEKDTGSLNRIIKQHWNFSEKPVMLTI